MDPTSASITAAQVPALLLAALPSLVKEWPEIEEENADPEAAGGRLGYLDAAWVVRHLADRLAAVDTSEFDAAFDLIELLITNGDPYVSELGVIGYVEGLQMATVTSRGVDPASFRPWLRPVSARYWDAINAFWAHGTPIPDLQARDAEGEDTKLGRGEFVTADRLILVSRVAWLELEEPLFVQAGERYRVDWGARTVTVLALDGAEHVHASKPSGPDSVR